MVTLNGGVCQTTLNKATTHLVTTKDEGVRSIKWLLLLSTFLNHFRQNFCYVLLLSSVNECGYTCGHVITYVREIGLFL